jgi:plastocyanin
VLSIAYRVALAVGISLSVAAISSIFITWVASQNVTISNGGSGGDSQSNNQVQQSSQPQNATSSSAGGSNTSITSTITVPEGATAQNFQHYQPNPVTVAPNSQITWNNKDSAPHTATALDGSFDTGTIQPGASGSATVPAQGTIPYHCTLHPWMTAILQVSSSSSSAGGSSSSLQQNGTGAQQPQQQEGETQTAQSSNNSSSFNQTITTASDATEGSKQSNSTGSISAITQNYNSSARILQENDACCYIYA